MSTLTYSLTYGSDELSYFPACFVWIVAAV